MRALGVRIFSTLDDIPAAAWDALLSARSTPFLRHAWLHALESSGCAAPSAGWEPRHLTLWRDGALVAAAPAWVKDDSDGDFARDWDLGSAASRARLRYYPKLCLTVPFTPCTGQRILVAPGEDRAASVAALVEGALALCRKEKLGTFQVLFPDEDSAAELGALGLATRVNWQFHWRNDGYRTPEEFLARFNSKKRNMLKRERAAPAQQGIRIRTVRGEEMLRDPAHWARLAHALHRNTVDKLMWGRRWLNESFYLRAFAAMPEQMELVIAEREGEVVAGAFNVASPTRLYGRYWGCFEEHPFLHFNVCLYHSIDDCIARGLQVFEGGAGGEHKVPRGFLPTATYSSHAFLDARADAAFRAHLAEETPAREESLKRFLTESPIFKEAAS